MWSLNAFLEKGKTMDFVYRSLNMRFLVLVLLVVWSCTDEDESDLSNLDAGHSNVIGERFDPWTASTSADDKDDTIDTYFVKRRAGHPSDCVVIDASQELLDKMNAMLDATDSDYKEMRRQYREKLARANIFCRTKYHYGRKNEKGEKKYRYYSSFYNGTASDEDDRNSYQMTCYHKENTTNYVCRDIAFRHYKEGNNFTVVDNLDSLGEKRGVHAEISRLDYYAHLTYDDSKKMLRVPANDLKSEWQEISPEKSREISEYQLMRVEGHGKQWVRSIGRITYTTKLYENKIQKEMLYPCDTLARKADAERRAEGIKPGEDNSKLVSNFQEEPVCKDLFLNPHNSNCSKDLREKTIEVCKLKGRGILIKRGESDFLRVTNCEYQPHAKHFYCSGKEEGSDEPPKIYFERYGVYIDKDHLPSANCPVKLAHFRTNSIGCGKCPHYDFAEDLAERGCDYDVPYYCNYFTELETKWHRRIDSDRRPYRCDLQKTCVFRRTGFRFDSPYCHSPLEEQLSKVNTPTYQKGCSTELDNDKCHFKTLYEIEK